MYDPDPCSMDFVCNPWVHTAGFMYVDIFCGCVLLMEAVLLYILLRKQMFRWLALVPLALVLPAFALARRMWDMYSQLVPSPQAPPDWSRTVYMWPAVPDGALTTELMWATVLIPLAAATIAWVAYEYRKILESLS